MPYEIRQQYSLMKLDPQKDEQCLAVSTRVDVGAERVEIRKILLADGAIRFDVGFGVIPRACHPEDEEAATQDSMLWFPNFKLVDIHGILSEGSYHAVLKELLACSDVPLAPTEVLAALKDITFEEGKALVEKLKRANMKEMYVSVVRQFVAELVELGFHDEALRFNQMISDMYSGSRLFASSGNASSQPLSAESPSTSDDELLNDWAVVSTSDAPDLDGRGLSMGKPGGCSIS